MKQYSQCGVDFNHLTADHKCTNKQETNKQASNIYTIISILPNVRYHLNKQNASTASTYAPRYDLGSHPVRSADHGFSFHTVWCPLSAEPKVDQLNFTIHTKQNVVRLDVTMHNLTTVKKLESFQTALTDATNLNMQDENKNKLQKEHAAEARKHC